MSTVTRNAPVSAEVKLTAFFKGRRAGKSNAEIAKELGMKTSSFQVAISQLRKKFEDDAAAKKAAGVEVVNPFVAIDALKVSRAGKSTNVFDSTELLAKLAEVDAEDETETVAPETESAPVSE